MLLINRINSNNSNSRSQNYKEKNLPGKNSHFRKNSTAYTLDSPSSSSVATNEITDGVTADAAATATPTSVTSSSLPLLGRSPSLKKNNSDATTGDKKSKFSLQGLFRKRANSTSAQKEQPVEKEEEEQGIQQYNESTSLPSPTDATFPYNSSVLTTPIQQQSCTSNSPAVTPHSIMDNTNHITIIRSIEEEEEAASNDHVTIEEEEEAEDDDYNNETQPFSFDSTNACFTTTNLAPVPRSALFSPSPGYISHQGTMATPKPTHPQSGSDHERYTSFTADCVSLQNSEMSTAMDLDSDTMIVNASDYRVDNEQETKTRLNPGKQRSSITKNPKDTTTRPSITTRPSAPKRNLKSILRIGSFSGNHNIRTTNPHKDAVATKVSTPTTSTSTATAGQNQTEFSFENDDEEDEYCSESELQESQSDLDFDPKHEESEQDYKFGGYHPVCKGDVYFSRKLPNREYVILRKLGWGHFSTVWLAKSRISTIGNGSSSIHSSTSLHSNEDYNEYFVAIKFVKSNKNYKEAARDEIKILQTLQDPVNNHAHLPVENVSYFDNHPPKQHPGYKHLMKLLDDFEIAGPNGNHICMVFEILGENVLNLIYKYKKFYRHVDEEIKRKNVEGDEAKQGQGQSQLQPQQKSEQVQPGMKFGKWDNKYFKRNTKSKLSLGLTKKDICDSTIAPPSTASTISSSSTTVSPIETVMEASEDIDSSMTTAATGATGTGIGFGFGLGASGITQSIKLASTDPWHNSMEKKLKAMSSDSLVKLIKTSHSVGGIPLPIVKTIVKQLLLAVDYMHHCGIIHTDLKPENILIDIDDINKVIRSIEDEKVAKARASNSSLSRAASLIKRGSFSKPNLLQQTSSFAALQQAPPATVTEHPENVEQEQQHSPQHQYQQSSTEQKPRQESTTSITSSHSSNFYYKRSKNSISGKYDSPIRSSKPLSSASTSSDIFFKDVDFDKARRSSVSKAISPKNFSLFDLGRKSTTSSNTSLLKPNSINQDNISIKIADLGNATYTNEHFTNQIQTRQYRSPEIILKYKSWGSSTDLWSIGCIIFELITGDFLFDPHDGKFFDKDEDHLAQIVELLGRFPSDEYLVDCKLTGKFFKLHPENHRQIIFKNIDNLKYWGLEEVLVEKYKFPAGDPQVKLICDLILKCLTFDLDQRYDARSLLKHPWFCSGGNSDADDDGRNDECKVDEEMLKNLPNVHNDLPGYTCEA
ncbi:hypothetical protein CANMA_001602 [Candida margitis]|uniref:uncharacterized protein n=1 Tax=Candida margitis TaxID=1775924 RepID=UPI002226E350|nr:uncharacterized protein CANMA_001602 [Candida margitis]KAI5969354.1 hypothetical protein CANMA_001602 [Candida margitis]